MIVIPIIVSLKFLKKFQIIGQILKCLSCQQDFFLTRIFIL